MTANGHERPHENVEVCFFFFFFTDLNNRKKGSGIFSNDTFYFEQDKCSLIFLFLLITFWKKLTEIFFKA